MGSMRIAFAGKGGVGKSAIAGTAARILASCGQDVLVLDSDTMPGLAWSLGMPRVDAGIPDDATVEKQEGEEGPRFRLRDGLTPAAAIEEYAAKGPDGIRLLQLGKLGGDTDDIGRSTAAYRSIVFDLADLGWHIVGDLPGGTRQPFFGWGRYASIMLVVAEPTQKSLLSARRLRKMTTAKDKPQVLAVANKTREPRDVATVMERTLLPVVGDIPWDEAFAGAEQDGAAPFDAVPDAPAVRAIASLVERLHVQEGES